MKRLIDALARLTHDYLKARRRRRGGLLDRVGELLTRWVLLWTGLFLLGVKWILDQSRSILEHVNRLKGGEKASERSKT